MIAMPNSLLILGSSKDGWKKKTHQFLEGTHPQCIVFDAGNSNRAYCGTFGNGCVRQMMVDRVGTSIYVHQNLEEGFIAI
jgi:hypothetical protein